MIDLDLELDFGNVQFHNKNGMFLPIKSSNLDNKTETDRRLRLFNFVDMDDWLSSWASRWSGPEH